MTDLSSVIQRVLPQTVAILAPSEEVLAHYKKNPQMAIEPPIGGSGFIYSKDGHVITNHHVIAEAEPKHLEVLLSNGKRVPATLVGSSKAADVAVLKIKPFKGMEVADVNSDNVGYGDPVFAIGAPSALEFTVTQGIVSHPERFDRRWRHRFGDTSILPIMQTDAPVNPGNSGGALFNAKGQVIGVNTFIQTPIVIGGMGGGPIGQSLGTMGLNFALKGNGVKDIADKIIKKGASLISTNPGFNLLHPTSLDRASMRDPEARITKVEAGSNAAKAGLMAGDVLISIDGNDVPHAMAAQFQLFRASGNKATLKVRRQTETGDETVSVELTFKIPETEYFSGWDNPGGGGGGGMAHSKDHYYALVGNGDGAKDEGLRD